MENLSQPTTPTFQISVIRDEESENSVEQFRQHVIAGLSKSSPDKAIDGKFVFDDKGSELHTRVLETEAYYPTRTEVEIFKTQTNTIIDNHLRALQSRDAVLNIIDLGAGDGRKAQILMRGLLNCDIKFEYLPIDISRQAIYDLVKGMRSEFAMDDVRVHGFVGDNLECLSHILEKYPSRPCALLYVGCTVANFQREDAVNFLKEVRSRLRSGDLIMVGTDLRKNARIIQRAYDDEEETNRHFKMNLLTRMNRELHMDFDEQLFQYVAVYSPRTHDMENYLVAQREMEVTMGGEVEKKVFLFKAFEGIHISRSHKHSIESLAAVMMDAGFRVLKPYLDSQKWCTVMVSEAKEDDPSR